MEKVLMKVLMSLAITCFIIGGFLTWRQMKPDEENETVVSDEQWSDEFVMMSFDELKQMNDDFIGKIQIGELVYESVVKSQDNDDYTHMNIKREPYGEGTVFLDYRNQMDDMNLILYGSTVFSDEGLRFGPLHQLTQTHLYVEHKDIVFELEQEKRVYEIIALVHFHVNETDVDYSRLSYTEEELEVYENYLNEHNLVTNDVQLSPEDHLLTIQTDIKDKQDSKLVVVAKEMNRNEE